MQLEVRKAAMKQKYPLIVLTRNPSVAGNDYIPLFHFFIKYTSF